MSPEGNSEQFAAVQSAAEAYCLALHRADTAALAAIFHGDAHLYNSDAGTLINWPLAQFLDRVGARSVLPGTADFDIEAVDVAGPGMAMVKLSVAVPPRRFTDYLNFLNIEGTWRIIAKVFRTVEGPAL